MVRSLTIAVALTLACTYRSQMPEDAAVVSRSPRSAVSTLRVALLHNGEIRDAAVSEGGFATSVVRVRIGVYPAVFGSVQEELTVLLGSVDPIETLEGASGYDLFAHFDYRHEKMYADYAKVRLSYRTELRLALRDFDTGELVGVYAHCDWVVYQGKHLPLIVFLARPQEETDRIGHGVERLVEDVIRRSVSRVGRSIEADPMLKLYANGEWTPRRHTTELGTCEPR